MSGVLEGTVHLEPVRIGGPTLCCHRPISQLQVRDTVTRDGKLATCGAMGKGKH